MKNIFKDYDSLREYFDENQYIKTALYITGGIILIWGLGKAAVLLTDATKNFKSFCREF